MADGFGGGSDVARKLEIMRDSRVGSYGALAIVLSVAVRGVAVAALAGRGGLALMAAGSLSRAAMGVPMLLLRPARADGLGAALGRVPMASAFGCAGLALVVALLTLPWAGAVAAVGMAVLAALVVSEVARRQIGGFTGDVLGGCAVVVEAVVLTVMAVSS